MTTQIQYVKMPTSETMSAMCRQTKQTLGEVRLDHPRSGLF